MGLERSVASGSSETPTAATADAAAGPGKRTLTEGLDPQAAPAAGAGSSQLRQTADQLRAGGGRPGPTIPVTVDLLSLFSPQAPRQPSVPSKFKDAPYTEIKASGSSKGQATPTRSTLGTSLRASSAIAACTRP